VVADDQSRGSQFLVSDLNDASMLVQDARIRAIMNWDYSTKFPRLSDLYEKNKASQWNVTSDIEWNHEEKFGAPADEYVRSMAPFAASPDSPVPRELWDVFRWEYKAWMVNQFLHGEQGALLTTARLVETVPDMGAKFYAASQVADEARHVEAYARYIDEKLGVSYPINHGLKTLLRDLLADSRWDIVYLGMQVIVEGLALAATRIASAGFGDPIITAITKMIARDEARHVSFGVIALHGLYDEISRQEFGEREEFLLEAIYLMSQRFLLREIWEKLELDVAKGTHFAKTDPMMVSFRQLLFRKVIQILRQINLLTPKIRSLLLSEALAVPQAFSGTVDF
jgi:hypothetical protein